MVQLCFHTLEVPTTIIALCFCYLRDLNTLISAEVQFLEGGYNFQNLLKTAN